jgi:hypothetical protein
MVLRCPVVVSVLCVVTDPTCQSNGQPYSGFPFVAFADSDEMIGMVEINLGIDTCLLGTLKEVGDARKRVEIFFGESVKTVEVDAEAESTVLLLAEQYWSFVRR